MRRCITFLTDFGLEDHYVGTMKGVALRINPEAVLVDISHLVPPQDIVQGAFLLEAAAPYFPQGTIHVAVVDPGVGTTRRPVAIEVGGQYLVGPDNGLLVLALRELAARQHIDVEERDGHVHLPVGVKGVIIENPAFRLVPTSDTFHGRDIFTPAAAHLSLGVPLAELGVPVDGLIALPIPLPRPIAACVEGRVVHVDRFGNLVTNLRVEDLPPPPFEIEIAGRRIERLSRTFQDGGQLLSLIGSTGRLEVAVANGSAADTLGIGVGERLLIRRTGRADPRHPLRYNTG